jgi:glycosyltransferase involved in cell wall biosynthesis
LHIIPNPIITDRFPALCREEVSHPWFADDSGLPVVLSVGSLEPRKDFATLIDAFANVRARRRCRLVILGEGREKERLLERARQRTISEDVDLPGFLSNPYPYMKKASVFVLSSHREGSPVAIVEALACGTPVVSTDCPSGPSETLQQGQVGKLVPVGDSRAMAQAIEETLDNPPSRDFLKGAVSEHRADLAAEKYLQAMGIQS